MAIPPGKTDSLSTGSVQSGREAVTTPLATDNRITSKAGTILNALVKSIEPIPKEQLAALQARIAAATGEALTRNSQGAPQTDAARQQAASEARLQQLLTRPQLQLVQLQVGNRNQPVILDTPVTPGDRLAVMVRADGQLQLLRPPAGQSPATATPTRPSASTPPGTTGYAPAGRGESGGSPLVPGPAAPRPMTPAHRDAVADALKVVLPKQLPLQQVLNYIARVTGAANPSNAGTGASAAASSPSSTPPAAAPRAETNTRPPAGPLERTLLSPPARQAVSRILHQLPQASGQTSAAMVRQVFESSGNFLESRIARGDNIAAQPAPLSGAKQSDPRSTQISDADLKQLFIQLHSAASARVPGASPSPFSTGEARTSLDTLLQQMFGGQARTPDARAANQALRLAAEAGLARIRFNQLQSLAGLEGISPDAIRTAGLTLEMPVRMHDQMVIFGFFLQEKPLPPEEEEERQRADKRRQKDKARSQWTLFMEFELAQMGKLAAELKVIEDNVSTRLWAEQADSRSRIRARLHELRSRLEADGIEVEQMECSNQPPPSKAPRMAQSLVDIRT